MSSVRPSLGERWLPCEHLSAGRNEQVVVHLRSERVILFLEPGKLGLKISHTLLEAAHLGDHTRIWTAYVAEYSLRHGKRSSTLSDQSGHTHRTRANTRRVRGGSSTRVPPSP